VIRPFCRSIILSFHQSVREVSMNRRRFLWLGLAAGAAAGIWPRRLLAGETSPALAAKLVGSLESSPYVYVSPLRGDGSESRCHGEVWFAWLDDAVLTTVASDRWKVKAVDRGLDHARLWVGDYGTWKRMGMANDDFRAGPSFRAKAEKLTDPALMERLLAVYGRKYPAEIDKWRDRMRKGLADGSRVLIRYTPVVEGS
jgi:hypothetical protein